jgi:hypothetical protein
MSACNFTSASQTLAGWLARQCRHVKPNNGSINENLRFIGRWRLEVDNDVAQADYGVDKSTSIAGIDNFITVRAGVSSGSS